MANIHSMLQQKSGPSLGPVKAKRVFPPNPGSKYEFLLIEDGTGSSALKVWDGHHNFQEGQVFTITGQGPKGGLKVSEYNGKISIDANSCRVVFEDGPQAVEAVQNAGAPITAPVTYSGDKQAQVAIKAAESTHNYIQALISLGYTRDEALMLGQGTSGMVPLWWFGEKGI